MTNNAGSDHYGARGHTYEHIDDRHESVNFSYQRESYGYRANYERPGHFGSGGHYGHYERPSSDSGSDRDDNYWREDYSDGSDSAGSDDYDENYHEPDEFICDVSGCQRCGEMLLFCAFVGEKNAPFYIEIDGNTLVSDLKHAIQAKNAETVLHASTLQLFVAKKLSGQWMNLEEANDVALDTGACPRGLLAMDPVQQIKNVVIFESGCEFGECQIHVLVVLSPRDLKRLKAGGNYDLPRSKMTCIQNLLKNCDVSGDLPQPGELLTLFEWDDNDCGTVKGIEAVGRILEFTGPSFYVRKEILCVLENFKNFMQLKDASVKSKQQFIFVGSPGTGKSCILALICCYLATVKKVPVVLHCCVNTGGDNLDMT